VTDAGGALRIGAGEGVVEVRELQPAGKRRMTAAEFLRGRQTPPARAT
jgi:methionyl-tRNA formyltransferase